MSGLLALRALAAGVPLADTILGACRLESGNVDAFGSEAVAAALHRAPLPQAEAATGIDCATAAALMTSEEALFADVYDGRLGRLWRVGQASPGQPEPAVSVAFDTDLHQTRADVFVVAVDHPALSVDALEQVAAAGRELIRNPAFPAFRIRVFAIRAFGDAAAGAALFACHALAGDPIRTPSLALAVACWHDGNVRIVQDQPEERDLRTRIAG